MSISAGISSATREALLDAAEREMSAHGIDGADLDLIRRSAGQRNRSAVRYHFGGRDGLVRAVAQRRRASVDAARSRLLASTQDAELSVVEAVDLMVEPALTHLRTPGGRSYLVLASNWSSQGEQPCPTDRTS